MINWFLNLNRKRALERENEELRAALEKYANPQMWDTIEINGVPVLGALWLGELPPNLPAKRALA